MHPELNWGLHGHEEGEKEARVRQNVAESVHEKEEKGDALRRHRPRDELGQDYLGSSMGQGTVPEEQVGQPIQVLHLNVGAGEHI